MSTTVPAPFKTCSCGLAYDQAAWEALPYRGTNYDEIPGEAPVSQEMRNCTRCKSTMQRDVPPAVGCALKTLQLAIEGSTQAAQRALRMRPAFNVLDWRRMVRLATQAAKLQDDVRMAMRLGRVVGQA